MIGRLSLLLTLLVWASPVGAIAPKSANYYCTTDAAGGVAYEERLKRWQSTNFRPSQPFVLKLTFLSSSREKMFEGAEFSTVNRFDVAITPAGTSKDAPCRNLKDQARPVDVWDDGWVRCEYGLTEIRFSPENNRFLKAYLVGYVDGNDDNDNTPSIAIGVCTKLN